MRILGKGKTAQAVQKLYPDALMFDDLDKEIYDCDSDEQTIVSPGIPPHNYLVQNTKNKQSDYDLFLNEDDFTIWISGTNGKTTTTGMISFLLQEEGFLCGGNIGTPLADLVKDKQNKKLILETSSFTLHYTNKVKPNIYVLLPITEDHTSWHGTFQEYEASKLKPLNLMDEDDIAIIPSKYKSIQTKCKLYTYEDSNDLAKQFKIESSKINFKEPFLLDAMLALIVKQKLTAITDYKKINSFVQDPHKIEEFYDDKQRVWVDDSKATNYDATIQALKGYKNKKIFLILGGDDKGADLTPLFDDLIKYDLTIYSIGSNTQKLFELAKTSKIECEKCFDLEIAVDKIYKNSDFCLKSIAILSPAAASLDQFSSYKERGDAFKKAIFEKKENLSKI